MPVSHYTAAHCRHPEWVVGCRSLRTGVCSSVTRSIVTIPPTQRTLPSKAQKLSQPYRLQHRAAVLMPGAWLGHGVLAQSDSSILSRGTKGQAASPPWPSDLRSPCRPHPGVCVTLTGLCRLSPTPPPRADSPVLDSSEIMEGRRGTKAAPRGHGAGHLTWRKSSLRTTWRDTKHPC